MDANDTLGDAVFVALKDHLGTYSEDDTGPAFWRVPKSFAMTAEGLQSGTKIEGLEAVFALYPDPNYTAQYEFGEGGMRGILYHALVLKQWGEGSVMPAYGALVEAFPLMTLRTQRQPRQIPTDLSEALACWVPVLTD